MSVLLWLLFLVLLLQILQQWESLALRHSENPLHSNADREFAIMKHDTGDARMYFHPGIAESGRALMNEALRLLPLTVFGNEDGKRVRVFVLVCSLHCVFRAFPCIALLMRMRMCAPQISIV